MSAPTRPALLRRARVAILAAGALFAAASAVPVPAGAATAPTNPGAITVTNVTATSATLTWGASTDPLGIVGYQVYRQGGTGANALIATTDGSVTHYNATNLYGNTNYTFQVVALDVAAQSSGPTNTTFTTSPSTATTPPSPPSSSSVAAHPFSDGRIDLVWGGSPSSDVSGYLVLRDGSAVGRVDLPGGLRYSDNGLAASSTYTYTIEALDSAGTASASTAGRAASTLASGTVQIARGPYVSNVTATSAIVSWWTNVSSPAEVDYGTTSPSIVVTDATSSLQHQVTISGLAAGTSYVYTVGTSGVRSAQATFRTAAPAGTSFSFAAIADFGGASPGEAQNGANIATAGTSFIQTLGDNVYPSAGLPDPNFATTYSDFDARLFKQFGSALRDQAFFPANGNQEYYAQGAFWNAFPMLGTNHSWYSYDWGDAHIAVIDTQQSFAPASTQYMWLQSDLQANQSASWRIVVLQDPPYSSTSATSSSKPVQQDLVPLFQQQNVELVLSGNSHNYERSAPMTSGSPAAGGITYIVSGAGGNGHNTFTIPAPAWSAARDDTRYEFAKVTVSPTALTVDAVDAATNTVFDTTTLQKALIPTALVINTAPAQVAAGSAITIAGKLTRTDTSAPVANETVQLESRPNGSTGSYSIVGTVQSSSTGTVTFTNVVVSKSTQYILSMAASGGYAAATSAARTVTARRSITIAASHTSVKLGTPFTISGQVTPSSPGVTILLQRKIGTSWSTVSSKPVSSTSTYSFSPKVASRGTYVYRTQIQADSSYVLSTSPTVSVAVQ